MAQLVEQLPLEPSVVGSNPPRAALFPEKKVLLRVFALTHVHMYVQQTVKTHSSML